MNAEINKKVQIKNPVNSSVFLKEEKLREELLIQKLVSKLGKSRREVRSMLSKGLLATLTKVPFSVSE